MVYVADGLVRYYDEETLPDPLKTKMAMILAAPQPELESEVRLQKLSVYTNSMPSEFDEIGWRVSNTYFCLVVDRATLEGLRSGTDAGAQSQRQDQSDS